MNFVKHDGSNAAIAPGCIICSAPAMLEEFKAGLALRNVSGSLTASPVAEPIAEISVAEFR